MYDIIRRTPINLHHQFAFRYIKRLVERPHELVRPRPPPRQSAVGTVLRPLRDCAVESRFYSSERLLFPIYLVQFISFDSFLRKLRNSRCELSGRWRPVARCLGLQARNGELQARNGKGSWTLSSKRLTRAPNRSFTSARLSTARGYNIVSTSLGPYPTLTLAHP